MSDEATQDAAAERQMHDLSRRSFLWTAVAAIAALGGLQGYLSCSEAGGQPWPLRRALDMDEGLARSLYKPQRLAPTYPASAAVTPKINSECAMGPYDPRGWALHVCGLADMRDALPTPSPPVAFSDRGWVPLIHDDLAKLPYAEIVTDLTCISGWKAIVRWGGVPFVDFVKRYPPKTKSGRPLDIGNLRDLPSYVGLITPDGGYYVGIDMESALHPQTMLCWTMNGSPLPITHGWPLRLICPVKYGYKSLKRIGFLRYGFERPPDYWAERGVDYYAGL
jgi:hypothetical protein